MKQYKTVAAPTALSVNYKDSQMQAVEQYATIFNKEAEQGWELEMIQQIPVIEEPGCLGALFGKKEKTTYFNMLFFSREVNSGKKTKFEAETTKNNYYDSSVTEQEEDYSKQNDNCTTPTSPLVYELVKERDELTALLQDSTQNLSNKQRKEIDGKINTINNILWDIHSGL